MSTVAPIFKDAALQKEFDENGFIKITLLSTENVEQLLKLYHHYFPNPSKDFYSSSYENDFKLKKEISTAIQNILIPNLEKVFTNYTCFGSAFLSKGDGSRSEMPMHQDWTIVDETQFVALNIWTPLQSTTEENGTLEVIKGSHRWHNTPRAPTLPFYFQNDQTQLKKLLTPLPTKATEAVVLNQAVIHYSKKNTTGANRIALTTGIKSKGAPMIFHYWNKEKPDEIERFHMEEDFLISFTDFHQSIFKRPVFGTSLGTFPFQLHTAQQGELERVSGSQSKAEVKLSFTKKLMAWIKG